MGNPAAAPLAVFLLISSISAATAAVTPLDASPQLDPWAYHAPGSFLLKPAAGAAAGGEDALFQRRSTVYKAKPGPVAARADARLLGADDEVWVFTGDDVIIDLGLGRPSARGAAPFDALGLPLAQVHSLNFYFGVQNRGSGHAQIFDALVLEPPSPTPVLPAAVQRSCWSLKFSAASYKSVRISAKIAARPSHRLTSSLMATPAGLEPATIGLEGRCSIQLSYGAGGSCSLARSRARAYRSFVYGGLNGSTACGDGRKSCPHRLWGALGTCDPRQRDTAARAIARS